MHNKIASLILDSDKSAGLSEIFLSSPEAAQEAAAGKVFVLAEIGGRKNEGQKIFDFLVSALDEYYYQDEKIGLRDKIEGLKIENIFEAALAKINKGLIDFLAEEKIRLNSAATSLTIGVIYENKLHFSSFGRNRALLIYPRREKYEIINVEANAAEAKSPAESLEMTRTPKIFSSVISGEIPTDSYFLFTSEALPEYLSGKEMLDIVTKLPPVVACEQIKNSLEKINTYIPFLGIIIKNTVGAPAEEPEEIIATLRPIKAASSLDRTEQETERVLSPSGLISFSGLMKKVLPERKKADEKPILAAAYSPSLPPAPINIGTVKSLRDHRPDSFQIQEKIFFKRRASWLTDKLRAGLSLITANRRRALIVLGSAFVILAASLGLTSWNRHLQEEKLAFENQLTAITDKESLINSHLLYNDDEGAKTILADAQNLLETLPKNSKDQQAAYQGLALKLSEQEEKIQKIVRVSAAEKTNDLAGLGIGNLVFASGSLYAGANNVIYALTPGASGAPKTEAVGAAALSNPQFDKKDSIYYWDGKQVASFNIKTKAVSLTKADGPVGAGITSFKIFNGNLYALSKASNQIYLYKKGVNGFTAKSDWLKAATDLATASDLYIDGDIYVVKDDGAVLKFYKGQAADYSASALSPAVSGMNKIIAGAKNIYIFSPSAKRLAVLSKEKGTLLNQYIIESLAQPNDFAIDEAGKIAYILDGEAIYKIILNQ